MDQKNTIVKCKAHPDCLFNHNGVCDNYVINIGADGKCDCYVETENAYTPPNAQEILEYIIKLEQERIRGQQANNGIYDNACDVSFLKEDLEKIQQTLKQDSIPCTMKVAEFNKPNKNRSILSDHLCDIRCVSAHYTEDGELYCALIQDFPEHPLRCSAYDDGGEE